MRLEKCNKRDRERARRKNGPVTDSRSVFTIEEQMRKSAEKAKRKLLRRLHKEVEEEENGGEES